MNTPGSLSYINGLRELAVLVVDDDPARALRITLQLEEAHCEAMCLASCADTLTYLPAAARHLDVVLVDARLPHLTRLVHGVQAQPAAGALPLYAVAGGWLSEQQIPPGMGGWLPKPLPSGVTLYGTLRDLRDHARGVAESFMPLDQAATQLELTPDEARRQFYTPVIAGIGPAVRMQDIALHSEIARGLEYAEPIQQAFTQGPWRDLSWRARGTRFNEGLPPELRLPWRSLQRIAQGEDRELARAVRVLAALQIKLGLRLGVVWSAQEKDWHPPEQPQTCNVETLHHLLQLASGIVQQHNLLSTASDQERCDTINRLIDWWNWLVLPVLTGTPPPEWATPLVAAIHRELTCHAKHV